MKKADDISQSMCIMPWIGLATDPSGGIRPCCWMEALTPEKFLGNPKDYRDSEYLKNVDENITSDILQNNLSSTHIVLFIHELCNEGSITQSVNIKTEETVLTNCCTTNNIISVVCFIRIYIT